MARPAIFVTLIAATLIGPCLCCCTLARAFAHPVSTAQINQPFSKPAERPTCPHCRPAGHGPAANVPQPSAPADPTQPCPCCDGTVLVVAVTPPTVSQFVVDVPFVALLPVTSDTTTSSNLPVLPTEYPPGRGMQLFLLDSCHRLRC